MCLFFIEIQKTKDVFQGIDRWITNHLHIGAEYISFVKVPFLFSCLILLCLVLWWLTKKVLILTLYKFFLKTKVTWDDLLVEKKVFEKLSVLLPLFVISLTAPLIFTTYPTVTRYLRSLTDVFIIATIASVMVALLNILATVLSKAPSLKEKPIFSYIQVVNIFVYFVAGIMILSRLLGKSPLYFLGAMGAMTAVLLLIFKDTILGFVASIQISVYDMVRVGDWIEMPDYNTDGDVLSINLNTVKVQNWDKTISTVPTYAFITGAFKNWRGMSESGGRRIKRALYMKMSSFRFCEDAMIEKFKKYRLLETYIVAKQAEMKAFNEQLGKDAEIQANIRRLSNIGLFRVYASKYLEKNSNINHNMTSMVRQLAPTPQGLPLELYCFSADQRWLFYEDIMSDIFDHLITIAPEFGLEVFEQPTGKDLAFGLKAQESAPQ